MVSIETFVGEVDLCIAPFVKAVHSDNCVNESTARQEVELWMLRCGLWKEHYFRSEFHLSFCPMDHYSNGVKWFMSCAANAGSSSCLGADIHPLIATICLCARVFLCVTCVCMTKWERDWCKGLIKRMWVCLFHSVWGWWVFSCLHVLDLCPPRSRVSLLETGYSNVSLYWVLMDFLNWEMWPLKPAFSASLKCHHTHFTRLLMGLILELKS